MTPSAKLLLACLLTWIFCMPEAPAQTPVRLRSTLGAGSANQLITLSHHYFIQQSIGQSSVIGSFQSSRYRLMQGFLQPMAGMFASGNDQQMKAQNLLHARIFPNPFSGSITIIIDEDTEAAVYVDLEDLQGRSVARWLFEGNRGTLSFLENIPPGMYVIKLRSGQKQLIAKLVKSLPKN